MFALYLQDEITIMDRLTLVPALRWDHWENEAPGAQTKSLGVLNPKIGAVYQVTDFLFFRRITPMDSGNRRLAISLSPEHMVQIPTSFPTRM